MCFIGEIDDFGTSDRVREVKKSTSQLFFRNLGGRSKKVRGGLKRPRWPVFTTCELPLSQQRPDRRGSTKGPRGQKVDLTTFFQEPRGMFKKGQGGSEKAQRACFHHERPPLSQQWPAPKKSKALDPETPFSFL